MSDNWVVQNLENALETWNEKLSEIWTLITTTPQNFKGGNIWKVIVDINGAVQAIGLALLVLFFVIGMVKTCGSFTDVKKPEHALKLFVRFALAKGVITYGMELMLALFNIVQGTISTIMNAAGFGTPEQTTLPAEMVTTIEDCGFFESIPLWAVTLIGGLFITVEDFSNCICTQHLHRYRFPHLQENLHRMSARVLSRAIVPFCLREQSLYLLVLFSPYLLHRRQWLILMQQQLRRCGHISGNWYLICSFLSVQ